MSAYPAGARPPTAAGVYDCWLGGNHHLPADRELAASMAQASPWLSRDVRAARTFLGTAVTYVARRGVRQYLDLGAGLPVPPKFRPVHETARAVGPGARVAYVDNDDTAAGFGRCLLAGDKDAAMIQADLSCPGAVLGDGQVRDLIDFTAPACVILAMVLHLFSADDAKGLMRAYTAPLQPGSYVIVSLGYGSGEEYERIRAACTAGEIYSHSREDVRGWLSGLDIVSPGLADVVGLFPGAPVPGRKTGARGVMGAIARVP